MKPVRTASSDMVYVGPPGIGDLHCQRVVPGRIRSVWYLTPEERAAVAAGANIGLDIVTEPIPPVAVFVIEEQGVGEDAPDVAERLRLVAALRSGTPTPDSGS